MKYEQFQEKVSPFLKDKPGLPIEGGMSLGFMHHTCECCQRSQNDGERYEVIFYNKDNTFLSSVVCEDCMMYLLIGHLDWWEGEINCK